MKSWFLVVLWLAVVAVRSQTPEWIWRDNATAKAGETVFFRKSFSVPFAPKDALLIATGDDEITLFLNGQEVARSADWRNPVRSDVLKSIKQGQNTLAVKGRNGAVGQAGVIVKLEFRSPNNYGMFVLTDKSWVCTESEMPGWQQAAFDAQNWKPVVSLGAPPVQPWGDVFGEPIATAASSLTLVPEFKAELLCSAKRSEGSWICMAFDNKGRIIVSPEGPERPLLRIELSSGGAVKEVQPIPAAMHAAMGLCYAHNSLYVNGRGPKGVGLYRLVDRDGNDRFDPGEELLLKNFEGDSEHGYHAVTEGPDGMIYVINGNMTRVPSGLSFQSPLRNYAEDLLLPRMWDPTGHARDILAPGGHVLRTDPQGKEWSLFCGGFRNAYDFDFSPEGELFTFDSDMEYDVGLPWYRPTRILHCVSGADFGWRSGSGKWPDFYADSLPAAVDVGLSSPTGVKFATRSNFPEKYRRAFFVADWNYGRILASHLEANGASYKGTFETFLSGKPLPVVDLEFGPDGAMYFITGGWRTQSGLYRVSYTGRSTQVASTVAQQQNDNERALRHQLERFHGRKNPEAVQAAWPYLESSDRFMRYAARVAVESQEPSQWIDRALEETNTVASLTALLAVARCADPSVQPALLDALDRTAEQCASEELQLDALRVLELALIRMGRPQNREEISERLLELFSAASTPVKQELTATLVFLEEPGVIPLALARLKNASTQQEQVFHAFALRNYRNRWQNEQLRAWFQWCDKAVREYRGGVSFARYLENARRELLEHLPPAQRDEMSAIAHKVSAIPETQKVREFVQEWKVEDLSSELSHLKEPRDLASGRLAFNSQCAQCHRFGTDGGVIGPDLTSVASRFSARELLDHIILPSQIISDRFATVTITRLDGEEVSGIVLQEDSEKVSLQFNPLAPMTLEIHHGDIKSRTVSKVSMMPEGLLNQLTKGEILNLLAFLTNGNAPR